MLTPIAKTWPSQWGLAADDLAIQVHGGYGYTRDYPVEQFYRDNRLNPIHEGTHGIQALDLLGRKVVQQGGAGLAPARRRRSARRRPGRPAPSGRASRPTWTARCARLAAVTATLWGTGDPELALANASAYLEAAGHVVVAWLWLEQALATGTAAGDFYEGKRAAARYFYRWELPKVHTQLDLLESLDRTVLDTREIWLADTDTTAPRRSGRSGGAQRLRSGRASGRVAPRRAAATASAARPGRRPATWPAPARSGRWSCAPMAITKAGQYQEPEQGHGWPQDHRSPPSIRVPPSFFSGTSSASLFPIRPPAQPSISTVHPTGVTTIMRPASRAGGVPRRSRRDHRLPAGGTEAPPSRPGGRPGGAPHATGDAPRPADDDARPPGPGGVSPRRAVMVITGPVWAASGPADVNRRDGRPTRCRHRRGGRRSRGPAGRRRAPD